MPVQFSVDFSTTLVTKRVHKRIVREANEEVGKYIVKVILPRKFSRQAFVEYPATFKRRTKEWRRRKQKMVGHQKPNVLTGKMKAFVLGPAGTKIRKTSTRGSVQIKNYFKMPERQRQELEVVNQRDRNRMADVARDYWLREIHKPENARKRRVKKS